MIFLFCCCSIEEPELFSLSFLSSCTTLKVRGVSHHHVDEVMSVYYYSLPTGSGSSSSSRDL